jgi:16S rRNA (guanine527-N7)-methyltransferase
VASLGLFERLLRTRAVGLGAIAASDHARIAERHIQDSLRALACIGSKDQLLIDLGSGAGLPGVPLAIALPDRRFVLVESRRRRGAFLEFVADELALANVSVMVGRAQDLALEADLCLARAFAPQLASWRAAEPLLRPGGRLVYFAGASWRDEPGGSELERSGVAAKICAPKQFNWQGPLVIMGRFSATDGSQDHGPKHAKHL